MTLQVASDGRPPSVNISPFSPESLYFELGSNAMSLAQLTSGVAWIAANQAMYVPFYLGQAITVTKLWWANATPVGGNIDVGIYDVAGTRLLSTGSTAQAGVSQCQVVDTTDTGLNPGVYFMAMSSNTSAVGTQTIWRVAPAAVTTEAAGVMQQATAFALPATATFAHSASAFIPFFGLTRKTTF